MPCSSESQINIVKVRNFDVLFKIENVDFFFYREKGDFIHK